MPKQPRLSARSSLPPFRLLAAFFFFAVLFAVHTAPAQTAGTEEAAAPAVAADVWSESWADKVVAVSIRGAIMGKPFSDMPELVERALDKADADGANLVVLEIDSPGGAVNVCDALSRRIFESKTPVISLVIHKAVSGGAMLASAAREIVMTRTARMGDIQPMQMSITGSSPGMDDRTAEKIEVDIRTIMKVFAHQYGRPAAVLEAMVSRASSLYQVKFRDAPTEYLTGHELEVLEKNIELGRDRRRIADTKIIKPEGKLLELTGPQAVEYGIASEVVDSADAFYAARGIEPEELVRPPITEGEFDLKKLIPSVEDLGLPVWVVILLGVFLVVGVAGFVTEYHAPGFGVAGILGILGILGGLLLAFTPDWNSDYMQQFMWEEVGAFTFLLFLGLLAAIAMVLLISHYGERFPYLGRFFLTDSQPAGFNPYPETLDPEPHESARMRLHALKGKGGVAETMLRPAGKVRLDSGELLDVVTDGVYVEAGKRVKVIEAAPNRIVVAVERV